MSVAENKDLARRFIEEVWDRGDMAVADEVLAPDLVNHDIDGSTTDRAGFLAAIVALRAANPGLRFVIDDMLGEGDRVATRVTITGLGEEGQPRDASGIGIVRIANGRIAEQWADTNPVASATREAMPPGHGSCSGEGVGQRRLVRKHVKLQQPYRQRQRASPKLRLNLNPVA